MECLIVLVVMAAAAVFLLAPAIRRDLQRTADRLHHQAIMTLVAEESAIAILGKEIEALDTEIAKVWTKHRHRLGEPSASRTVTTEPAQYPVYHSSSSDGGSGGDGTDPPDQS